MAIWRKLQIEHPKIIAHSNSDTIAKASITVYTLNMPMQGKHPMFCITHLFFNSIFLIRTRIKTMKIRVTSLALLALLSTASNFALAAEAEVQPQPIMINNNGIAFSRMEEGQVIAYDPVAAFDSHTVMLADCGAHKAELQGVSWCFASAENAQTFMAATTESGQNKYVPFGGARGDPRTAVRVGDSLVLNGNFDVRARFLSATETNMSNALKNFETGIAEGKLID
jgi:hypothetical protein